MKKEFPGHFANGQKDIEKIWAECIFVLDANVLLSLYRYSDSTRAELLTVFGKLQNRIWVPHQVAQEYLINRLSVIADQVKVYDDAVKKVDALKKLLENKSQHPFVGSELLSSVDGLFSKLVNEFKGNQKAHERRVSADEIKDRLEVLLEGRVGAAYDRLAVEDILKDGKLRYDEKIPPGYADVKKGGDSVLFADRCRPYGDYIAWLQTMDKAKLDSKPVVFITGDVKEDWWVSILGRTVGPQPQLIEEFLTRTGQAFYMYTPDLFLERAGDFLNQAATEQSLNEIRDVRIDELESLVLIHETMKVRPISEPKFGRLDRGSGKEHEGMSWMDFVEPVDDDDARAFDRRTESMKQAMVAELRSVENKLIDAYERKSENSKIQDRLRHGFYDATKFEYSEFLNNVRGNTEEIRNLETNARWIADRLALWDK